MLCDLGLATLVRVFEALAVPLDGLYVYGALLTERALAELPDFSVVFIRHREKKCGMTHT